MPCFILSMKMKLLVKHDNRSIKYNNFYEYHNLILPFCLCPGLNASLHVCLIFRSKASVSVPGGALCFAGVGYDPLDLALYKFMPKKNQDLIHSWNEVHGRILMCHYQMPSTERYSVSQDAADTSHQQL